MDLIRSSGERHVFGRPDQRSQFAGFFSQIHQVFWVLAAVSVGGLAFGFHSSWAWQLLVLFCVLILAAAALAVIGGRLGAPVSDEIILEGATQEVLFPPHGIVAGSLPMRLVRLRVASGEGGKESTLTKEWWVVLEGPVSEEAGERRHFQTKLYGPGFKGDMEVAHAQILRLGPWRVEDYP